MRYLSQIVQEAQTKLYKETGAFFAFSKSQFEEGKKEGVEYVALDAGIICPKGQVNKLVDGLESIYVNGIATDIAENGIEAIIERELHNHEAFYTNRLSDTLDALKDYGVTREQVRVVYNRIAPTIDY